MKKLIAAGAVTAVAAVAAAAPSQGAGARTVALKDNFFSPKSLTVKKGTVIRFAWKGKAPHDVKATGPARFRIGTRTSGTVSKKLTKPGLYKIVCEIHAPGMKMTIRVKK